MASSVSDVAQSCTHGEAMTSSLSEVAHCCHGEVMTSSLSEAAQCCPYGEVI